MVDINMVESGTLTPLTKKKKQGKRWETEVGRVFVSPFLLQGSKNETITLQSPETPVRITITNTDPRIGWFENCILQCGSEDNLATDVPKLVTEYE